MTPHHIILELSDSQQAAYNEVREDLTVRCRKGRGVPDTAYSDGWQMKRKAVKR